MKLKHAIIETMDRDLLKAVCDDLGIDGVDRRSREDMAASVSRARRAKPEDLVEYLSENQVKAVCELMRFQARGRRKVLIEQLLNGAEAAGRALYAGDEKKNGRIRRARAERSRGNDAEEEVSWMPADEIQEINREDRRAPTRQAERLAAPAGDGNHRVTRPELVWPGKYDDEGNVVEPSRVALPFQLIEVIEEGRASREALVQGTLPLFGARPSTGAEDGWRNKLIWGENAYVMASLLERFAGKVDLIYIDPPFLAGRDFKHSVVVGEDRVIVEETKTESLLQVKAYYDTWGRGLESYLQMLYARLQLARDLLSTKGSIYVHMGPGISQYVQVLLDEVFGPSNGMEIVWKRTSAHADSRIYGTVHDSIFFYWKTDDHIWNPQYVPHDPAYVETKYRYADPDGRRFRLDNITSPNPRPNMTYEWKGHAPPAMGWRYSKERMAELDALGRIWYPDSKSKRPQLKRYLDESPGMPVPALWADINPVNSQAGEDTGYDTQKPETLLERVIRSSSDEGSLVADFFLGSGTTVTVAERLGRRWIGCDLGRFSVQTARKRLLDLRTKDPQTGEERGCRPFELLNLGRYERKYWQGLTFGASELTESDTAAAAAYVRFVLDLYRAQPVNGTHIHGKKGPALIHVGAVDSPVTISEIEAAVQEAKAKGGRELHILGWEWEMGLYDPLAKAAKAQHGITLRLLHIPREVMDRRAVDAGDVHFFDLAYLEVDVRSMAKGSQASRRIKVKLKDFVIPNTDLIPDEVRNKIRKWSDYIDYWAVDWDFRDDTFLNQWQTYRTRRDRSLAVETPEHSYEAPGKYRILVKVVDIFGNDTSHLLEWEAK